MAISHAKSGELIEIRPLAEQLVSKVTSTLLKTKTLEVLRLVMPAGTSIPQHQVPGEITVQCLEGRVTFEAAGAAREMAAGQMLFLDGSTPHGLHATQDSSMLVTILLQPKAA